MANAKERTFRFSPSAWRRETREMTDAGKGRYMDDTAAALEQGWRGMTELADAMLDDAERRRWQRKRRKEVGR